MDILSFVPGLAIAGGRAVFHRFRAYRAAIKLEGIWAAEEYRGRYLFPMHGASATVITHRGFWSQKPNIVNVYGRDFLDGHLREHDGYIVVNPECPTRATRTVIYRDSGETTTQEIEIGSVNFLIVNPTESGYGKHALRRAGTLGLN